MRGMDLVTMIVGLVGLGLLAAGLYLYSPALALVVVGAILILWSAFISWGIAREKAAIKARENA